MQRARRARPYPALTRAQRWRRRDHRRRRTLREATRAEQATPARPYELWTLTDYVNHTIDVRQPAMVAALNRLARTKLPARRDAIRCSADQSIRVWDRYSTFTVLLPPCPICNIVVTDTMVSNGHAARTLISWPHDRVPRTLPCGHDVCRRCCSNIIRAQENTRATSWPCPFCRHPITTSPNALPKRPRGLNFIYYGYSYTVPLLEAFYRSGEEPTPAVVERLYRYLEAQWEADPMAFEAALDVVETESRDADERGTYECIVRLA